MKYLLIMLALLFAFSGCATTPEVTHEVPALEHPKAESAIDPHEVSNTWTHCGTAPMAGYPLLFFINPDVTAEIQYVAMMFHYDLVLAYTYIHKDDVHLFVIDWDTGEYDERDCDQENWKNTFKQFTTNNKNSI